MGRRLGPHERMRTEKGWGYEDLIWNRDYCGKVIFVRQDRSCSWHYHAIKDEVLYLESGIVVLKYSYDDDIVTAQEVVLRPHDSFHVPVGLRHRFTALQDSFIFEFSTHHDDADSIRLAKGD